MENNHKKRKAPNHDETSKAENKQCKKKHWYKTKYNPEWANEFPIQKANNNPYAFYCVPCKKNVSCEFQGKRDVERHCDPNNKTSSHNKMVRELKNTSKISGSSSQSVSVLSDSITKAEVLHTNMIVHHNLPFLLADHLAKVSVFYNMFSCINFSDIQCLL